MFRYFISREFFLTLLGLIGAGILLYLLVFLVILPAYTRHGEGVLVPDVQYMGFEQAQKKLKTTGLRYEVRDSTFQADFDPLTIVDQYPAPLSRVKPGRKVFLTLNRQKAPMVRLPELVDLSLYQAKSRLESWKLSVGEVRTRPDFTQRQTVLEVRYKGSEIQSGTKVPQGGQIDLIISEGRTGRVGLPDLTGLSMEDALSELRRRDLILGAVAYREEGDPINDGLVIRQIPAPGSRDSLPAGTEIDLIIQGKPQEGLEGPAADTLKDAPAMDPDAAG
jgi:beta-lactam-binding protein with PASTA domain